jgi:AraC-like DNA-binding protein
LPLPSPLPALFTALLALAGVVAAAESVRLFRARTPNPDAVRLAAAFVAAAAVHLLECALATSPWARHVPHLHSTTYGLTYGFGPAMWLLARKAARVGPGRIPAWVHAVPVVVGTTSLISWFRLPAAVKIGYLDWLLVARPASMQFGGLVAAQTLLLLGLLYCAATVRLLDARSREEDTGDDATAALQRLARVARIGRNVFAAYLPVFLLLQAAGRHTYQLEYVPGLLGAMVLVAAARRVRLAPAIPESTGKAPRGPGLYRKASLPAERVPALLASLERTMAEQRPYLDPELDLATLAATLGITGHQLSQLLNRELGVTFAHYVNERRVRDARRILEDPGQRDLTILAVALEVGFRSKNTFNRAFRKHAGVAPSACRAA